MKICEHCGAKLSDDDFICPYCDSKLGDIKKDAEIKPEEKKEDAVREEIKEEEPDMEELRSRSSLGFGIASFVLSFTGVLFFLESFLLVKEIMNDPDISSTIDDALLMEKTCYLVFGIVTAIIAASGIVFGVLGFTRKNPVKCGRAFSLSGFLLALFLFVGAILFTAIKMK